ncbi:MMPL family transporter [Thermococcus piezophilus]|nr:MMPL family transporter [Thermococcus piezophilus]
MAMAWNEWIVKHAKLVVALWIVIIILAAPLAVKLKDVTNYSTDQFLPKDVESVRVQDILSQDFPSFSQSDNQTYMVITNINVNDPKAKEAYERFKAEAKPYGDNFTSYYDAIELLQNQSYDMALNLTRQTANLTGILYISALNASDTFGEALSQMELLSQSINMTKESLPELAGAYLEMRQNLTLLYNQMMGLKALINSTDMAYAELSRNLINASQQELEKVLIEEISESVLEEEKALVPVIVKTVMAYDTNATGVLAKDPVLLKEVTIGLMESVLEEQGLSLDEKTLDAIYESGGNVDGIAKALLIQGTIEKLAGMPNANETARKLVEVATADPEGILSGEKLENATLSVVVSLAGNVERIDFKDVAKRIYEGESPRKIAEELFIDEINWKLDDIDAPEIVKRAMKDTLTAVIKEYPVSVEELEALVKEKVKALIGEYINENSQGLELHIDTDELVNLAFKFKDDPNAITRDDVTPIEEYIYPTIYDKAKNYIEMLKSPDNTTMLVLFVPQGLKGVSALEKSSKVQYENSLKAKEVALREFGKAFPQVEAYVSGTPVQTYETIKYGKEDNDKTTKFSIIGALIVLFIIMGAALLATFLPFTGVATATLTALGILYLLAKGDILDVGSWAQMLTVTTALGLGIDYSTYYLHRFREYLAEGYDHNTAASEALKRAKDAVLASASTDIIAFASFVLAYEFPIFKTMGIIAPIAVITVLLASLTLIPAITVLIGNKPIFWWPRHIKHIEGIDIHEKSRIADWATRHAKVVVLIALLLTVPAAYNFANFHGTHDIKLFIPKDSDTYHFLQLTEEKIGASVASPTYVVIEFDHPVSDSDLTTIDSIAKKIEKVEGVKYVYTVTQPYGEPISGVGLDGLKSLGGDRYISKDGKKVLIQVTGKYSATDEHSKDMVKEIRSIIKDEKSSGGLKDGLVGGATALALDLSNLINDVFWHRIFPVALLLMFLSLIPTLKGLPAVITTMVTIATGVLLSIWLSSWLFERVFGQQIMWFLPMMVFVVLMGVGIDYNSFFLIKARDEFERREPREALVVAAGTMDLIVIGLAAVLAATYGSLMTGATWGVREIGFALAIGVLLTAAMAVYFVGPATMALFGEKAWWPLFKRKND